MHNKNYTIIAILTIIFVLSLQTSCKMQKNTIDSNKLSQNAKLKKTIKKDLLIEIHGCNKCALWYPAKGIDDSKMEFDINNRIKNIPIILGLDSPGGTKALVIIGDTGYNLIILSNQILEKAFDNFGELKDGYYIQASVFDFDNDGDNEVVISIGNKLEDMGIAVYKYYDNGFRQIGYIEGQSYALVERDGTIATYNHMGKLLSKYKWNGIGFNKK